MDITIQTLKQRAYHEMKEFLIIALYLWVVLGLLLLYKSVILNQGISYLDHGVALVNALVLGKFVLIARAFHLGEQANDAPLIYPTLLKGSPVLCGAGLLQDCRRRCRGLLPREVFSQRVLLTLVEAPLRES